jgi:hypothetical protein
MPDSGGRLICYNVDELVSKSLGQATSIVGKTYYCAFAHSRWTHDAACSSHPSFTERKKDNGTYGMSISLCLCELFGRGVL